MDFHFRQDLPIARVSHIINIRDGHVQRAKYCYNIYIYTWRLHIIYIMQYIYIIYTCQSCILLHIHMLHCFNIDQVYICMSKVHRHSFSKIRNPSTIVAGKRQGCREISGIDKNHIPVSIQFYPIHPISEPLCHVHPFSPTSLFTTSSTSSTSRHRIRIQHRELQQPLAATGDWPAPVQPSVGKDRHEAFPRRKALCFEIKLATWKWDEFALPFSAYPWTIFQVYSSRPKFALIYGRKGVL